MEVLDWLLLKTVKLVV